jgi:hypothetical protein
VEAEPYINKYEGLQVLLAVLVVCANVAVWPIGWIALMAPWPFPLIVLAVGLLEVRVSQRMLASLTLRATEAPTSVRSAMAGLRPWLLGLGILTTAMTFSPLLYFVAL